MPSQRGFNTGFFGASLERRKPVEIVPMLSKFARNVLTATTDLVDSLYSIGLVKELGPSAAKIINLH